MLNNDEKTIRFLIGLISLVLASIIHLYLKLNL